MNHATTRARKPHGFTLVELLVVMAAVAILAAIAYPAYSDSVAKGRRAQARAALLELLQQQERYRTQYNCYLPFGTNTTTGAASALAPTPAGACGGVTASSVPFKTWAGDVRPGATGYWLSASACGGTISVADCIKVTATPVHDDPKVANLEMNSLGEKSCTGTAASTQPRLCWP